MCVARVFSNALFQRAGAAPLHIHGVFQTWRAGPHEPLPSLRRPPVDDTAVLIMGDRLTHRARQSLRDPAPRRDNAQHAATSRLFISSLLIIIIIIIIYWQDAIVINEKILVCVCVRARRRCSSRCRTLSNAGENAHIFHSYGTWSSCF